MILLENYKMIFLKIPIHLVLKLRGGLKNTTRFANVSVKNRNRAFHLGVKLRALADDGGGGLVGAHRTVGAQAEEDGLQAVAAAVGFVACFERHIRISWLMIIL